MSLLSPPRRPLLMPAWSRNDLWRRAGAVPSLDLNFAAAKALGPLVTFTRASSGTFINSAGVLQTAATDVPRFDHNPTTGESLGLLVEEQRTNLLVRSEEFTVSPWTLFGTASRSADVTVAPNGTQTADSVTMPVSSGIFSSTTGSENTTYTFSIWIRCDSTQSVRIVINTNLGDPTTKTVTATTTWQRFDVTKTTSPGTTSWSAQVDTGGGNTFYLWGAQLEAGSFPTSYIPTTTAAATRSADVASITGTNFSSWYNQTQGTVYAKSAGISTRTFSGASFGIASLNDGTGNNENRLRYRTAGSTGAIVLASNVFQFDSSPTGVLTAPGAASLAMAYAASNFGSAGNGGTPTQGSSGTVPTVSQLQIGADSGGYLNGTISRLSFWPSRLPNSTLQAITL